MKLRLEGRGLLTLFVVFICTCNARASELYDNVNEKPLSYDGYVTLAVEITDEAQLMVLQRLPSIDVHKGELEVTKRALDIDRSSTSNAKNGVHIMLSSEDFARMKIELPHLRFEVLVEDVGKAILAEASHPALNVRDENQLNETTFFNSYRRYQEFSNYSNCKSFLSLVNKTYSLIILPL